MADISIPDPSIPEIDDLLLGEYIDASIEDTGDEVTGEERFAPVRHFRPETLAQADWLARKYKAAADREAEVKALAEAEIARITEWAESCTKRERRTMEWAGSLLSAYALEQRRLHKTATTKLPTLSIRTTASGPRLSIVDAAAALAWARENAPTAIKTTEKVLVSELKNAVAQSDTGDYAVNPDTGEIIPGLGFTAPTISTSIVT